MKKYKHIMFGAIFDCIYEDKIGVLLEDNEKNRFWIEVKYLNGSYYEEYKEPVTITKYTYVRLEENPVMSGTLWATKEDLIRNVHFQNIEIVEVKWESK